MAVTVPAVAAVVLYQQGGNDGLPGGSAIVPAIVVSATALAAVGAANWSWPAASGNSNS